MARYRYCAGTIAKIVLISFILIFVCFLWMNNHLPLPRGFGNPIVYQPLPRAKPHPAYKSGSDTLPDTGIFFINYKKDLSRTDTDNLRWLTLYCSVESCVRATGGVCTVFTNDFKNVLRNFQYLPGHMSSHIQFLNLSLARVFHDTPLEPWYREKTNLDTPFAGVKVSDAARLALVYQRGGVYLDSDVVVVSSDILKLPSPSIPQQFNGILKFDGHHLPKHPNQKTVINSVLKFPKKHPFLLRAMQEFVSDYQPLNRAANGPVLLTSLLNRCGGTPRPGFCGSSNITALELQVLHPVDWGIATAAFSLDRRNLTEIWPHEILVPNKTVGVHWFHYMLGRGGVRCLSPYSILNTLAETYCPLTSFHFKRNYLCKPV